MKSRILRNIFIVAALPVAALILVSSYWENPGARRYLIVLGTVLQVLAVWACRRDLLRLIRPSDKILTAMGVERIPAAYEPGKYKVDYAVSSLCTWMGVPALALACLGKRMSVTVQGFLPTMPDRVVPNFNLLGAAFFLLVFGAAALCFWAKVGQAMVIANEGGESRRYLYRGFAEEVENRDRLSHYLTLSNMWHR